MDTVVILLEGAVVLGCVFLGVRGGGVALGMWGGVGTAVLVFGFGAAPAEPPTDAVFIILSVILAASAMQAAGGVDWMVEVAAGLIRKRPQSVTFVAPLVSFAFCAGAGTGNIVYPLLPVVYDVAYENDVRPERPLSMTVVASAAALTASPVSAATAAMLTLVEPAGVTLGQMLLITFPAVLAGLLAAAFAVRKRGVAPSIDPAILDRVRRGDLHPVGGSVRVADPTAPATAESLARGRTAALIFVAGVVSVVILGLFEQLRPAFTVDGELEPLSMSTTIQLVMFVVAALIVVVTRVSAKEIVVQEVWGAGLVAAIALFGVAWMASTFIADNQDAIVGAMEPIVKAAPILLAFALFAVAALTTSQSTATRTIVPLGLAAGLAPMQAVGMWPAVGGTLFFPANGAQIAAVEFDRSGSTRITQSVLLHSFQRPMLVSVATSVLVGYGLSFLVG